MYKVSSSYKKLIYCIIFLIVFLCFLFVVKNYFKPFFVIVFFIIACTPINNLLTNHKVFSKKINAVISIIFVNALIFIIIFLISNFIIGRISIFLNKDIMNTDKFLKNLSVLTNINLDTLSTKLSSYYNNLVNNEFITKGAAYTTDGLFTYCLGNIAAYFILIDRYVIFRWIKIFIPEDKYKVIHTRLDIINNIIKIEIVMVLITTVVTIISFMILSIDNAIVLGLICGILDILPYVGIIFVFLPLILYKFIIKEYIIAAGLILLYILIITSRQVMEMKFISSKLEVHPLIIMISLYIGMKLFGLIGIFAGPAFAIAAKEILAYNS